MDLSVFADGENSASPTKTPVAAAAVAGPALSPAAANAVGGAAVVHLRCGALAAHLALFSRVVPRQGDDDMAYARLVAEQERVRRGCRA
jgi:hypothetical protein